MKKLFSIVKSLVLGDIKKKLYIAIAAMVLLFFCVLFSPRLTEDHVDVQVNRTFIKGEEYLVYTDIDTYVFDDSLSYFILFPEESWSKIKENTCYSFTTIGFRIKLPLKIVNIYENVVDSKVIPCNNTTTETNIDLKTK